MPSHSRLAVVGCVFASLKAYGLKVRVGGTHCNVPLCGFLHVSCTLGLMTLLTDGFMFSSTLDNFGCAVPSLSSFLRCYPLCLAKVVPYRPL